MIPTTPILTTQLTNVSHPTRTYNILVDDERISGYTDDLNAVAQSIYLILNTERYQCAIYSWNYGVELLSLYGKPMSYVIPEVKRRITEALMQDDRIKEVTDFEFEKKNHKLHVTFTVKTIYGTLQADKEVAT